MELKEVTTNREDEQSSCKHKLYNNDGFLRMVGEFGPFQWLMEVCFLFMIISPISQIYIMYFTAPEPDWKCVEGSLTCYLNGTQPSTNEYRCSIPRSEWEFVQDEGTKTVTVDFDIYCGSSWLIYMTSSAFYLGESTGYIIMGLLTDAYGRKKVLYSSYAIMLFFIMLIPVMPNIWLLLVCRFLIGVFYGGNNTVVLISETVSTKFRPLATNILWCGWIFTYCLLSLQAYLIRDWKILFIVCSAPYLLTLLSYWFVPESPRWLRTKGRLDEAQEVFKRMAKCNQKEIEENATLSKTKTTKHQASILDLFKHKMAISTLAQGVLWFANGLVYYGLSITGDDLGGSKYLNFVYLSLIEIPSAIFASYLPNLIGRKKTVNISIFLAGIFCIVIPFIPITGNGQILRIVFGIVGKLMSTLSFDTITVWSFEIFPTNVRSRGLSFVFVASSIGSSSSPWIAKGLKVFSDNLPFYVLGSFGLLGALAGCLLEETNGKDAKDTLDEIEENSRDSLIGNVKV